LLGGGFDSRDDEIYRLVGSLEALRIVGGRELWEVFGARG